MSKESLDQFVQKVADSEELQARVGEEIHADALIALGAEHGCEFTADDLTAGAELSDEELDGVAGGIKLPKEYRVNFKIIYDPLLKKLTQVSYEIVKG
jgi:predicted ribosomally synthesized peptide with nif11-like leader